MNHVMIDIETLGTSVDAIVLSIAAIAFDPRGSDLLAPPRFLVPPYVPKEKTDPARLFFQRVDIDTQIAMGRKLHGSTLRFWIEHPAAFKAAVAAGTAYDLGRVLNELREWWTRGAQDNQPGSEVEAVWSHGATFDLPILEHAYRCAGQEPPWTFRKPRDTRTLFSFFPDMTEKEKPMEFLSHHPVWDAWRQAHQVQQCFAAFKTLEDAGNALVALASASRPE